MPRGGDFRAPNHAATLPVGEAVLPQKTYARAWTRQAAARPADQSRQRHWPGRPQGSLDDPAVHAPQPGGDRGGDPPSRPASEGPDTSDSAQEGFGPWRHSRDGPILMNEDECFQSFRWWRRRESNPNRPFSRIGGGARLFKSTRRGSTG